MTAQLFYPGYVTQNQLDYLRRIGTVLEIASDAWHFVPDTLHLNIRVYNSNHRLIIEVKDG